MSNYLKRMTKRIFRVFGLEIHRKRDRLILADVLAHIARINFVPKTVIDVGAAYGTFPLYETFPDAFHLLVEPLEEWRMTLESICHKYGGDVIIAAAGDRPGEIIINVHEDLSGSSTLKEVEGSHVDGTPRSVQVITLDQACQQRNLVGPYLIKVDVQGAELSVLDGASSILQDTEVIILEVSLFKTMTTNPEMCDVVAFMKQKGFVAYDIFGFQYRPLDGALAQIDMVFVKEYGGLFRQSHAFASPEQRERATRVEKAAMNQKRQTRK